MCFFFSVHRLYEAFLILRRTERHMIENVYVGLHVKHKLFSSDFNNT